MTHPTSFEQRLLWLRYLWTTGWRALDLDEIPSYSKRHKKRLVTLLWASMPLLVGWICVHQVVAPDIGSRSWHWLGVGVVPHSALVCYFFGRLKPSWREYVAMYAILVAYVPLQFLFSISHSGAAPYLLAGSCFIFLILSNLMVRFRFGNAVLVSLFTILIALWLFARQANGSNLMLCFAICAVLVGSATLYVNYTIGNNEMYYIRLEQHFRLVLSGGKRDLWEFDSAAKVFKISPWGATRSEKAISYSYDDYLAAVHPEYRPALIRAIEDSMSGRAVTFHLEFQMRTAEQVDWRWVELAGYASERNANGTAGRLIGTSCDVTDRKSLHSQLEQQSGELEQAGREKAEFLAMISHSIRTPLNAVIGATSVLATDELQGEAREMVDTIQRSGQLLLTVLSDVLDLSSTHPVLPQLELASFDPQQVLRRSCELIGPLARQKNLDLRLLSSPELGSQLTGDAGRLQQVLINLLSNAVKFTDRGSVRLSASVEASSDPGAQTVTFAVSDTGAGIEEQAQRSLFQRFEQLHPRTYAGPAGSGLGLAISQRLVRAMGGLIGCQSKRGTGSTFSFTLRFPVVEAAGTGVGEKARAAPVGGDSSAAPQLRVLVAEDNLVNQRVLACMLKRLHCYVQLAANGAEAVEACRQGSFDVVFMDCDMPVLNGLEATRRIRQLPAFATVPIIAATAHALTADLDACLEAGMSDTLTKPVTFSHLTAALAEWAGGREPGVPEVERLNA